jgi:TrmH family RNA methyltransferase
VAARKLLRRAGRDRAGRFLVEGAQAVREALDGARVRELLLTAAAAERHPALVEAATAAGARISPITERAAESLSDTVTPQGLIAVCDLLDVPRWPSALGRAERRGWSRCCAGVADPGNAGAVSPGGRRRGRRGRAARRRHRRPHNAGRAGLHRQRVPPAAGSRARHRRGARRLAAPRAWRCWSPTGTASSTCTTPAPPRCWPGRWRGSSAGRRTGAAEVAAAADHRVRVPIYGRAESLNLATAAAVCLYASAGERRR